MDGEVPDGTGSETTSDDETINAMSNEGTFDPTRKLPEKLISLLDDPMNGELPITKAGKPEKSFIAGPVTLVGTVLPRAK